MDPRADDDTLPPPEADTVPGPVDRGETMDEARRKEPRISKVPERIGRYRVLHELGRGGMGIVYAASEPRLERRVALKVLVHGASSAKAVERFEIEARLAARLRHPNIVGIHEVGVDAEQQFIVMDLIKGDSLRDLLLSDGPFDQRRAALILERAARALSYAHTNFVLHRDIKPGNIIVGDDDQPVITDFGLAKDVGSTSTPRSPTLSGQALGTPAYMSPEQARGQHDLLDRRSDIYSLGATLYELLTGKQPFEGSMLDIVQKLGRVDPTKPSKLRPDLDRDLEVICLKCLEPEPRQRYVTAQALAHDLRSYLDHEPIAAHAPTPLERLRRWFRRHERFARGMGMASAVAAALLVVTTTAFVAQIRREHAATEEALRQAEAEKLRRTAEWRAQTVEWLAGELERLRALRADLRAQLAQASQAERPGLALAVQRLTEALERRRDDETFSAIRDDPRIAPLLKD